MKNYNLNPDKSLSLEQDKGKKISSFIKVVYLLSFPVGHLVLSKVAARLGISLTKLEHLIWNSLAMEGHKDA